jgi:transcriptional regulator NrdR family protein
MLVTDRRESEQKNQIRRRYSCKGGCNYRFSTYESLQDATEMASKLREITEILSRIKTI